MAAAASGGNVAPAPAPAPTQPFPVPAPVLPSGGAGGSMAPAPVAIERKVIGKGSFGAVLKPALPNYFNGTWHEYPENVTKLFFKEKSRQNLLALKPGIESIVGKNNGHRINMYQHAYKVQNLPANLQASPFLHGKSPTNNLFPVRMPDLGVDLSRKNLQANYKEIRKRPVSTILAQTLKLLQQVKKIKDVGYIHGDIRAVNIMINPTTGVMTLIDFDWLMKRDNFERSYPFGFYCHPPETLSVFYTLNSTRPDKITDQMNEYNHFILHEFDHILPALGYPNSVSTLKPFLIRTGRDNSAPFITASGRINMEPSLQTFDSYSLAWALLSLYSFLYAGSVAHASTLTEPFKATFKRKLVDRVPAGTNLDAASKAILAMTTTVLVPLSEMTFSTRLGIDEAVVRATEIVAEYEATLAGSDVAVAAAAVSGAVGGGSVASVGGGGASDTRRARRTRRQRGKSRKSRK